MKFMQLRRKRTGKLHAWLELIRLSYLFSVPGDFLAGAALTAVLAGIPPSWFRMLCGSAGMVLLYAFGAIYNDICDQADDHFRRPERPLPSRRIEPGEALGGAVLSLAAGVLLLAFCGRRAMLCTMVLVLLTGAYDSFLKKRIESGVVSMGLGRGLVFLTGSSIVGWHFGCLPVFGAVSVYAGLLAWISDGEERHQIPGKIVFYPAGVLAAGWVLVFPFLMFAEHLSGRMLCYSVVALLAACLVVICAAVRIYNRSVSSLEMRKYECWLLLALMPWQAGWVFLAGVYHPVGMMIPALCLLLLFPFLGILSRRYSDRF